MNNITVFGGLLLVVTIVLLGVITFSDDQQHDMIIIDSAYDTNEVAQYHREADIDTNVTETWKNISFDTIIYNETRPGYKLVNDNQSIQTNFSGIVLYSGKITVMNNATNSEVQKISIRVCNNLYEKRCTQSTRTISRPSKTFETLKVTGTSYVETGDNITVQYRVDDTDLDIIGDPVFDNPVPVALHIIKISD